MEYEIGISCRHNYLRPSIQGMHLKIVERDTMDEVVEYIESILDDMEMSQYYNKYWSYMNWEKVGFEPLPKYARYGVMEFQAEDGMKWSIDISEHDEKSNDYKEPKFKYIEMDEL